MTNLIHCKAHSKRTKIRSLTSQKREKISKMFGVQGDHIDMHVKKMAKIVRKKLYTVNPLTTKNEKFAILEISLSVPKICKIFDFWFF